MFANIAHMKVFAKTANCFPLLMHNEKLVKSSLNKIKEASKKETSLIWAAVDSNHRPHPYQGCALTT